jgi:dynein heavy chain
MKAISDKTFRRLKEYVENLEFFPEEVKEGSRAAMSVCVWIRAVYHFCVVYRDYFPKQQRVIEAKKILDEVLNLSSLPYIYKWLAGYKTTYHHWAPCARLGGQAGFTGVSKLILKKKSTNVPCHTLKKPSYILFLKPHFELEL